jgi:hypothetical protein
MKTKVIIDSSAALEFFNNSNEDGPKMSQKDLGEQAGISEQKLITWKNKAPKVAADVLKIQELTGAPLDLIIKEVPSKP